MSDKVKDALDHASSLRFPENVLADEVRRLTAALSEAQRERDTLLATAQAACGWPGHGAPSDGHNWVEELAGFLRVTQSQRDTAWDRERALEAERDALKGEGERLTKALASEEEISRAFSRSARRLEEERDAAVKRAEEAERSADILQNAHRGTLAASVRASQEAEAAKHRLALAERVVEEQDGLLSDLREFGPERIPESRWDDVDNAVAEYRKAGGK